MSLLKKDIIKKEQIDKNPINLDNNNKNEEFKVKAIYKNTVYVRKSSGYLLELYHLVF